jgi:hypothetical protein
VSARLSNAARALTVLRDVVSPHTSGTSRPSRPSRLQREPDGGKSLALSLPLTQSEAATSRDLISRNLRCPALHGFVFDRERTVAVSCTYSVLTSTRAVTNGNSCVAAAERHFSPLQSGLCERSDHLFVPCRPGPPSSRLGMALQTLLAGSAGVSQSMRRCVHACDRYGGHPADGNVICALRLRPAAAQAASGSKSWAMNQEAARRMLGRCV